MAIGYQKSLVAFLDVLGFKDMVYSKDLAQKKKLEKYHEMANFLMAELEKIDSKKNIKFLIVSDSIVMSFPVNPGDNKFDKLRNFLLAIGLVQYHLAKNNIWIRGAVSFGDVILEPDKNLLYGPAYTDAYLLQENHAKFPRVILDMNLVKGFDCHTNQQFIDFVNDKNNGGINYINWKGDLLYDWKGTLITHSFKKDYPLFIDWISNVLSSPSVVVQISELQKIYDGIQDNIVKKVEVFTKFQWVIDYLKVKMNKRLENSDLNEETRNNITKFKEALSDF